MCYSSEELITLNTLHEVSPPGTHFTAKSTEAMRIKSLAQGENILMLGIEPSTFVSKVDILTTTPNVHNVHMFTCSTCSQCSQMFTKKNKLSSHSNQIMK